MCPCHPRGIPRQRGERLGSRAHGPLGWGHELTDGLQPRGTSSEARSSESPQHLSWGLRPRGGQVGADAGGVRSFNLTYFVMLTSDFRAVQSDSKLLPQSGLRLKAPPLLQKEALSGPLSF